MAYFDPPIKSSDVKLGEGPARTSDIYEVITGYGEPSPGQLFYELEPAEVIKVYLDEKDIYDDFPHIDDGPDWSKYGYIETRFVYSKKSNEDKIKVAPLNSNIKEYPLPGEYVIVAKYLEDRYYTQKINLFNSVNLNSFPGMSDVINPTSLENYNTKNFIGNDYIRQLKLHEGDISFNGRFGQSIKFGSNITELVDKDKNLLPDTGKPQSPNIIIRTGQGIISTTPNKPVKEDINKDGASIWMTTNQNVPLNRHKSKITNLEPKKFDGKQIILNSDRVVFNSRLNNTFLYSSKDINLISKNRIVLEGHNNVFIGDAPKQGESVGFGSKNSNIQPVLRGDETMNLLEKLIDSLIEFATTIQGTRGSVLDFIVPISSIIDGAMGLKGNLNILKTRLDEPKSDIVKTT